MFTDDLDENGEYDERAWVFWYRQVVREFSSHEDKKVTTKLKGLKKERKIGVKDEKKG